MDDTGLWLGLMNLCCGFLYIGVSIPLYLEKIPMNRFYGFRITRAFESPRHWYAINRFGAVRFMVWSIPLPMLGVMALCLDLEWNTLGMVLFGLAPCLPLLSIPSVLLYARKL